MNIPTRSALTLILFAGTTCVQTLSARPLDGSLRDEPAQSVVDARNAPRADHARVTLAEDLPWLLRRAAVLDLRLHESPTPMDYELTANLLALASDMDPGDVELARDMAQAGWLAGDKALMIDATRRIIRADPNDTVAQLRLISARINEKQTIEERKALYDRFLGDGGGSIDPSVRSRLALDAALLEREAGNTDGFRERLHQATRLDITNKAAASLAAQYYSAVSGRATTALEYQLRLLYADPLDANVHLTIARLLAKEGALGSAKRFLDNAYKLFKLESGRAPEDLEELRIAIEWQVQGVEESIGKLNAMLNDQRIAARTRIEAFEKQQLPTDDLLRPEDIRYTLGVDRLRLLAAHAENDPEQVRSVLTDIERTINEELLSYAQLAQTQRANVNTLLALVVQRLSELQALRATVGLDAEKIRADIEQIRATQPTLAQQIQVMEPMALYAEGKHAEALQAAERYRGVPIVDLIRAQCLERLGRVEEAAEVYLTLAHANATNGYGAFAHARLVQLGFGERVLTESGREMARIADTAPDWIEGMIDRPASFQYLSVTQDKTVYHEGDRPALTIRLQNTSPIPLAVGPNAPIDSRLLIEPVGVATMRNGFVGVPRPKVVQLDNRLRLMPREEIEVQIVGDSVSTDWLIDQQPSVSMRQQWRVIQGYRPRLTDEQVAASGYSPDDNVYGLTNSPLTLTAETEVVQRLGLSQYRAEAGELIAMLESSSADARRRAVKAIGARMMSPREEDRFDEPTLKRIITALCTAYTNADPRTRAAMLLMLPQRHQVPAMIEFDDHAASLLLSDALIDSSVDPLVLSCVLLTRTDDPESPIFETIAHTSDPRVVRISEIVRARLRDGIPMLATVGPGLESMTPRFDGLAY